MILIIEVFDDVFVEKMMGDGYVVLLESGEIFFLIVGMIINIFLMKYVVGI